MTFEQRNTIKFETHYFEIDFGSTLATFTNNIAFYMLCLEFISALLKTQTRKRRKKQTHIVRIIFFTVVDS